MQIINEYNKNIPIEELNFSKYKQIYKTYVYSNFDERENNQKLKKKQYLLEASIIQKQDAVKQNLVINVLEIKETYNTLIDTLQVKLNDIL